MYNKIENYLDEKEKIYLAIIEFLEHSDEKIFCSISNIQNQQIV